MKYIFEDFECDLDYYKKHTWRFDKEGLSIYGLQVKDEILKEYEARNLRYYVPETKVFLVNDEDFITIKGGLLKIINWFWKIIRWMIIAHLKSWKQSYLQR